MEHFPKRLPSIGTKVSAKDLSCQCGCMKLLADENFTRLCFPCRKHVRGGGSVRAARLQRRRSSKTAVGKHAG
jgi:hypothetical protein